MWCVFSLAGGRMGGNGCQRQGRDSTRSGIWTVALLLAIVACIVAHSDGGDPMAEKVVGLWATMILKQTIQPLDWEAHTNREIMQVVLEGHKAWNSTWDDSSQPVDLAGEPSRKAKQNNDFHAYQESFWQADKKLWPPLQDSPAVTNLLDAIRKVAVRYLALANPSRAKRKPHEIRIRMWAAVHTGCSYHMAHYHSGSSIAGIYYVNTPAESGKLVLWDPRGLTPKHASILGHHIHTPRAGELIMFPAWLRHEVTPSCGLKDSDPRVVLAFNVIGNWYETTDANSVFLDLSVDASSRRGFDL